MDEKLQGWINLFKPKGISSFSAIYKIKKKFNIKKIGHAGTLDPSAEGILPIAINKTTKLIPFVNISSKKYIFTIKWGGFHGILAILSGVANIILARSLNLRELFSQGIDHLGSIVD